MAISVGRNGSWEGMPLLEKTISKDSKHAYLYPTFNKALHFNHFQTAHWYPAKIIHPRNEKRTPLSNKRLWIFTVHDLSGRTKWVRMGHKIADPVRGTLRINEERPLLSPKSVLRIWAASPLSVSVSNSVSDVKARLWIPLAACGVFKKKKKSVSCVLIEEHTTTLSLLAQNKFATRVFKKTREHIV